jgi:hypothetical protein
MFRAMFLPIIRSIWTVFTVSCSVYPSYCRHQPAATSVNTTRYCKYSPSPPDDGQKHRPKHVQPTWNNKLIYIVHLVGYFHSCITMYELVNVKMKSLTAACLENHTQIHRKHKIDFFNFTAGGIYSYHRMSRG